MNETVNADVHPAEELVFKMPDEFCQILLIEVARGRGLQAFVRPRARHRVWLRGQRHNVDAAVDMAGREVLPMRWTDLGPN